MSIAIIAQPQKCEHIQFSSYLMCSVSLQLGKTGRNYIVDFKIFPTLIKNSINYWLTQSRKKNFTEYFKRHT